VAQSDQQPVSLLTFVSCGFGFAGALMLVLTPFLPLAHIELLGESIEVRFGTGGGVTVVLVGVAAAAFPAVAIVRHSPIFATGVIPPAIVAIGWSGWYAFSRIPQMARLADSASLGWGGMLFVFSGPILVIAGMAALIATYGRLRERAEALDP
jgi:hypothetical protein